MIALLFHGCAFRQVWFIGTAPAIADSLQDATGSASPASVWFAFPAPCLAHAAWGVIITPLFMHHAPRSSLAPTALFLVFAAIVSLAGLTGCRTHDRRIYSTHPDKNLHTPNPWAPSTAKAAADATSSLGIPPEPAPGSGGVPPATPPAPESR